jgi:hypothetical protein
MGKYLRNTNIYWLTSQAYFPLVGSTTHLPRNGPNLVPGGIISTDQTPRSALLTDDAFSSTWGGGLSAWLALNWCKNCLAASAWRLFVDDVEDDKNGLFAEAAAAAAITAADEAAVIGSVWPNKPPPTDEGSTDIFSGKLIEIW